MWRYVHVIVVWLGFVEGNRYRKMGMRISVVEQRLSDNNNAIYELQDWIIGVNTTMTEIKSICEKEDRNNVDKSSAMFTHVSEDRTMRTNLMQAFEKEKIWVRNALSNIKRQADNLPGNIGSLKQPIDSANFDQRIVALEKRFIANWPSEIDALKRSIDKVETSLVERIEHTLLHVNNDLKELETTFTTMNIGIQANLNTLGERIVALENSKNQHAQESIKEANDFNEAYSSAISNIYGPLNAAFGLVGEKCDTNWEHFEDSCYEFRRDKLTFSEAVISCRRDDAYIVEIQSVMEDVFIDDLVKNENVWLGSNRNNTWMQTSRTMGYSNWSPQNNFTESSDGIFAFKANKGRWRTTHNARRRFPFVCEKTA